MANDPSLDVQEAIVTALKADSEIVSLMGGTARVYDRIPEGAVFPYIQVADDQTVDNSNSCGTGSIVYARVHVWSRAVGHVEAKRLGGRIRTVLNTKHTLDDHVITTHEFITADYLSTENAQETHGVIQFKFTTWEKSNT